MRCSLLFIAILTLSGFAACPATTGPMEATSEETVAGIEEPVAQNTPLGDGISAKGDSTTIPAFNAIHVTFPGQPKQFADIQPNTVDYSFWYIQDGQEQYQQDVTARFLRREILGAGTEIPENPFCPVVEADTQSDDLPCRCTHKELTEGNTELECEGEFPFAQGQMLRLITCGKPNLDIFPVSYDKKGGNPLADFIYQAFVLEDDKLWGEAFCPERHYVDYSFKQGAHMQLRFPLEAGKLYFIASFPRDYLDPTRQDVYQAPNPNQSGQHNLFYADHRDMSEFLANGRVLQVIMGVQRRSTSPKTAFTNVRYTSANSDTPIVPQYSDEIPGTPYCAGTVDWSTEQTAREKELFALVNQVRVSGADCGGEGYKEPVPPLHMDPVLRCAARVYSAQLRDQSTIAHTDAQGLTVSWRAVQAAFTDLETPFVEIFARVGENITRGPETPAAALKDWLSSDRHCANLMYEHFTHMGTAHQADDGESPLSILTLGTQWK